MAVTLERLVDALVQGPGTLHVTQVWSEVGPVVPQLRVLAGERFEVRAHLSDLVLEKKKVEWKERVQVNGTINKRREKRKMIFSI